MPKRKTILVAPLHWGLGHAARCIPIIRALGQHGYDVLLASDGPALLLLRKEFPHLPYVELPPYHITYSRSGKWLALKLLLKFPKIRRAIAFEKKIVKRLVKEGKVDGILSDNRFGVRHAKVPSVYMTHQLHVLSGSTTFLTSAAHQRLIKKFDQCWVPDVETAKNLTGRMGHLKGRHFNIRYIGLLSRMEKQHRPQKYDVLCLLSGPEPQRSLFEEICLRAFENSPKKTLLVRGVVEAAPEYSRQGSVTLVNFLDSKALERAINESEVVVARSGYTTIMDLAAMRKKAFFVPTPGQFEQKYLAKRLRQMGMVPSCAQAKFNEKKLEKIPVYKGLQAYGAPPEYASLFRFFEGK